ncbi:MAG: hypothetical protein IJU36_04150 [Paludibacteraceae bacterium]|nr:hypothetical protein [Paludibacteraceae bacterium]
MKKFKLKWLLLSFILSVASISQVCADETYDGNQWIYFNVQDNNWKWTDSSAKLFAVFKKTGQADTWTGQLAQVIGDVYGAKIPAGTYTTVDFVRQSSGGDEWNRISNKTLTSGKNYWYANGTEWGDAELYYYLSDNTFYFDNSVTQWVTPYFRIGRTNYADNIAMTQVAGTAYLWSYTRDANWENYHAIAITNASGSSSNIYTVSPATKSSTNIKENITSDSYAKCTAVDDGTYYTTTFQSSLPSYTVSYSKAGTGTGTLSVTKYNGSTYDEFTSGDPVYPTQIMKIIATPDEGNALTSLSISGAAQIGSTDTYYVTSNTTISATFTPEETHTVRILYKDYSSGDVIADYREIFNVGVTTITSISPKDIEGYEFREWTCGTHVKNNDAATDEDIDINTKTCSSDCDFTITAQYDKLTRLAFTNPWNWTNIYAYVWDGTGNNGWTSTIIKGGEKDYTTTINCKTVYYFEFNPNTRAWTNIIFHDGTSPGTAGSTKTDDLTIEGNDDKYYDGSQWTGTLMDYTVSVATEASYKGTVSGGGTARSEGCSATISAEPKPGYRFDSWEVTSGTAEIADASSATTTVTASTDATITARFNQNKIIYFDNTMSRWDDSNGIWVYLFSSTYGVWYDDNVNGGVHPGVNRLEYGRMTRIGTSNIYYYEYNTNSTIAAVAFTKADQHNNTAFYQTSAAWVTSFPTCLPCYMASANYISKNSTGYHSYGYWKRWGNTDSGFSLWIDEGNSTWVEHHFSNNDPSSNVYTTSVTFSSANTVYGYNVARCFGGSKLRRADYSGNIQDSDSDWPRELGESSYDGGLRTSSAGTYNFTLSLATDHIMMTVEYPLSVGDYRVRLVNDVQNHPSGRVIRARSDTRTDTVSFFIDHTKTNILYVDTCTNTGNPPRWNTITDVPAATLTLSASPYNTTTGIYKFGITRTKHKNVSLVLLDDPVYDGKYYIRTDVADGKWTSYMSAADNIMQYSDYSLTTSPAYDYYYTKWAAAGKNMHFVIANDYSPCITDTLMGDATYLNESDALPANANVRFSWNSATNETSRAFISGSSNINDRFLVLEGDSKMFDEDGNALTGENRYHRVNEDETITYLTTDNDVVFEDDHNWIYETTVKAQPNAKIKLTAKYNGQIQYFYGSEGNSPADSVLLIGGSGTDKYKMRVVYDFKTNRLIKAFLPEETITSGLEIDADLMIIREHQEEALQINFSGGSLSAVKTVYGAMKFNKWTVNGKEKGSGHASTDASQYERDLFWISFPFNVKLKDAFGFGTYGTHWIIERYDGKTRAQNGFWADSPSNWKFITPYQRDSGWVLNANEGYILALDLDEMTESSSIWDNDVEDVYVYFPSNGNVGNIQSTTANVTIDQTGYKCTIGPRFEGGDDRRIKDSYWHCIGVPSYANTTQTYSGSEIPDELGTGVESWEPGSTLYFYEWNSTSNTLSIHTSAGYDFKAMHSYMVQYAAETLLWTSVTNTVPASVAARLNETHDRNYSLALMRESEEEDHTLLRLTDDANVSNRFEFNYDLSKEYNAGRGNIWTVTADTVEVAGNSMPKPVQTTVVPVGVKVVANGEYTLAMPEGTNGEDVYLIDNAYGTRTNLGLMPYTVTLTAGNYEGRFALEFAPIQDSPTSLENDANANANANANADVRKVFVGGRLYIIRDGKVYDAAGQRIE